MTDEKTETQENWPVKDVQHFVGFANFCRRFIKNYRT